MYILLLLWVVCGVGGVGVVSGFCSDWFVIYVRMGVWIIAHICV